MAVSDNGKVKDLATALKGFRWIWVYYRCSEQTTSLAEKTTTRKGDVKIQLNLSG